MRMPAMPLVALLACAVALAHAGTDADGEAPYTVAPGLFDAQAKDLGLRHAPGTRSFTVFAPIAERERFNNGAVPIAFKGRLYVQWQSSARDEDSATVRARVIAAREETYVDAAVLLGTRPATLIRKHLLPTIIAPLSSTRKRAASRPMPGGLAM